MDVQLIRSKYNSSIFEQRNLFSRKMKESNGSKNDKIKSVALVDFLLFILPLREDLRWIFQYLSTLRLNKCLQPFVPKKPQCISMEYLISRIFLLQVCVFNFVSSANITIISHHFIPSSYNNIIQKFIYFFE